MSDHEISFDIKLSEAVRIWLLTGMGHPLAARSTHVCVVELPDYLAENGEGFRGRDALQKTGRCKSSAKSESVA